MAAWKKNLIHKFKKFKVSLSLSILESFGNTLNPSIFQDAPSLHSSSQFSSSSVQSKDTIHTQVSRATLEPPSPFPPHPRQQKHQARLGDSDTIVCQAQAARRHSTVSFAFRKNSITPNVLLR